MNRETVRATMKLMTIPTAPIPSGEMPNSHLSGTLADGFTNLK